MYYKTYGPFDIPYDGDKLHRKQFWDNLSLQQDGLNLWDGCGVYLFAIRAGGSFTPWYVGKTARSFGDEIFNVRNVKNFSEVFFDYLRGTPVIFFITKLSDNGKLSRRFRANELDFVERLIIHFAYNKNQNLINKHYVTHLSEITIEGILNNPAGALSASTIDLQIALGLR